MWRSSLVVLALLVGCSGGDEKKAEAKRPARPDAAAAADPVEPTGDGGVRATRDRPDAAPGEEGPDVAKVGPRMIEFFEALAVAAKDAKGDCERIAATFEVMFDEQQELLKLGGQIEKHREAEAAWKEQFAEKTGEIRKELAEAIKPCAGHARLGEVFESI